MVHPMVYLQSTEATEPDAALRALAAQPAADLALLDLAHALSGLVSDAIAYRPGVTHLNTTAAEALASGEGVRQDHAHALTARRARVACPRVTSRHSLCRCGRRPARGRACSAEIHVGGLGWVGFDAANRTCPMIAMSAPDRVGCARCGPIRGVRASTGMGAEEMDVTVAAEALAP